MFKRVLLLGDIEEGSRVASRQREVILPLCWALIRLHRECYVCPALGSPGGQRLDWKEFNGEPTTWWRGRSMSSAERARVLGPFSLEKTRLRGVLTVYVSTWNDDVKRIESFLPGAAGGGFASPHRGCPCQHLGTCTSLPPLPGTGHWALSVTFFSYCLFKTMCWL